MSDEILFRRATFGGFNRDDVLRYISTISSEKGEKDKAEKELLKLKTELSELKASDGLKDAELSKAKTELIRLKEELSEKNLRITELESEIDAKSSRIVSMQIEQANKINDSEEVVNTPEKSEQVLSAEKLVQDSLAYAERYIQSAEYVAGNIKKETMEKLNNASSQLFKMRETAKQLSMESEKINIILDKLSQDVTESSKGFSQDEKNA